MFNVQGFRRIFVGEPMPDKDDPKYHERREREMEAGRRFAEAVGLARLGCWLCGVADSNRKVFMGVMLSLIMLFFLGNVWRIASHSGSTTRKGYSVEMQDSLFRNRLNHHK